LGPDSLDQWNERLRSEDLPDRSEAEPARPWKRPILAFVALLALTMLSFRLGAGRGGADGSVSQEAWERPRDQVQNPEQARAVAVMPAVEKAREPDRRDLVSVPGEAESESESERERSGPEAEKPDPDGGEPGQVPAGAEEPSSIAAVKTAETTARDVPLVPGPVSATTAPPAPPVTALAAAHEPTPRRVRVQSESGRAVVARLHGIHGDEASVLMPDGQLGLPQVLIYTDEPFRPLTSDEMSVELLGGPFSGFKPLRSTHYLVLYRSTPAFAEASSRLLEELYRGLTEAFRKRDIPVQEPEFPLVAVIFRNEEEFRAHRKVAPDVQAYYEIFTNRIYFYQRSDRDDQAPEVAALRKPQTVAHEGTHQILQNVGVQPRLSSWPLWLIEGLAEYCATPVTTKKSISWRGIGVVNALHMATIRDLEDPLSVQVKGSKRPGIVRDPRTPLVEYLVTRTELTPTDYALAWAVTHYLAMKRGNEFVAFLKTMSQMPPLKRVTPEEHLAAFRAAFGADLGKMDRKVAEHLAKLKNYEQLPYYAVMFEQRVGVGMIKRAAIVSQSPSMIRQWLESVSAAEGAPPSWEAVPFPTRARALLSAEEWMRTR
jgi:hypothetical protein